MSVSNSEDVMMVILAEFSSLKQKTYTSLNFTVKQVLGR